MTGDGDRDGPGDLHPDEREDRPELDYEAAFAAIVADFAIPAPDGGGPWPAAEDVGPDEPPAADARPAAGSPDAAGADAAHGRSLRGPRHRQPDGSAAPGYELGGEFDAVEPGGPHDRFVPPDPPPISSTDLTSRLAWIGVIGGPVFLLIAALVWRTLPTLVVIAALAGFIGGFITLVARLPRDRGDGSDDGAVV
ncbi:hypothetical protein [Oryzihumus sp.]